MSQFGFIFRRVWASYHRQSKKECGLASRNTRPSRRGRRGGVVLVSHDQTFVSAVAKEVWVVGGGQVRRGGLGEGRDAARVPVRGFDQGDGDSIWAQRRQRRVKVNMFREFPGVIVAALCFEEWFEKETMNMKQQNKILVTEMTF